MLQIPICREHTYLGSKIGYGLSDRSTVMYRIKQSWHLFHRLHRILNCKVLPEPTRIRLWVACVRSVMFCGLTTVLLDVPTAGHLRSQVRKQLRLVTRSPAHLSHEPNHLFLSASKLQTQFAPCTPCSAPELTLPNGSSPSFSLRKCRHAAATGLGGSSAIPGPSYPVNGGDTDHSAGNSMPLLRGYV